MYDVTCFRVFLTSYSIFLATSFSLLGAVPKNLKLSFESCLSDLKLKDREHSVDGALSHFGFPLLTLMAYSCAAISACYTSERLDHRSFVINIVLIIITLYKR